jgi:hypothetical protein
MVTSYKNLYYDKKAGGVVGKLGSVIKSIKQYMGFRKVRNGFNFS